MLKSLLCYLAEVVAEAVLLVLRLSVGSSQSAFFLEAGELSEEWAAICSE